MLSHRFLLFLTILIPLLIISSSSSSSSSSFDHVGINISVDEDGGGIAPTKLVDSICKQTSNYTFCVESIYTDPRAPKAHDYFLFAYISFGLAYLNATDTLSYIKHYYLEEAEDGMISSSLHGCREDYEKAVSALEEAYNDLNSETYFDLRVLANSASHDALHCNQQLVVHFNSEGGLGKGKGKGKRRRRRRRSNTGHSNIMNSVLRKRNNDLKGLCEICVVVSNQFS